MQFRASNKHQDYITHSRGAGDLPETSLSLFGESEKISDKTGVHDWFTIFLWVKRIPPLWVAEAPIILDPKSHSLYLLFDGSHTKDKIQHVIGHWHFFPPSTFSKTVSDFIKTRCSCHQSIFLLGMLTFGIQIQEHLVLFFLLVLLVECFHKY
jgi:hypothetical protein